SDGLKPAPPAARASGARFSLERFAEERPVSCGRDCPGVQCGVTSPSPAYGPTKRSAQCPGWAGDEAIEPPRGVHWSGGSSAPYSTCFTSRSKAYCACGWISSSCGKVSL